MKFTHLILTASILLLALAGPVMAATPATPKYHVGDLIYTSEGKFVIEKYVPEYDRYIYSQFDLATRNRIWSVPFKCSSRSYLDGNTNLIAHTAITPLRFTYDDAKMICFGWCSRYGLNCKNS